MPAAPAAPPPAAPPAPAPAAPPAPAPAPAAPAAPAPRPDHKANIRSAFRAAADKGPNKANVEPEVLKAAGIDQPASPPIDPPLPKPTATPAPAPAAAKPTDEPAPAAKPGDAPAPTPADGKTPKPLGPWQLKDLADKKAKEYERRALDAEAKIAKMADVDKLHARAEAAEARLKELDEHIRYVDYSKSEEFKTKYQQPYEEAWAKAVGDLKELTVADAEGNTRAATAQDLVHLANLPLGQARKLANEMFGDAADDVMAHRRSVRELSDAQTKALDTARKSATEREQTQTAAQRHASEESARLFQDYVAQDTAKHDYFKPREGDDEWNTRLTKATEMVEAALNANPHDPRLTPEQRAEIVRNHANVRGRAIAFSTLKVENTRLKSQIAERDKELAEFKGAQPGAGDGRPADGSATPTVPPDRMNQVKGLFHAAAARNPNIATP